MLEIDRLSLEVRAAAAPERAGSLASRLRDAAIAGIERNRYALSLPGAPAYLFVDRVALQCTVSSDWDDAAIGAEVARSLAAALERGLDLPGTVAFRDRAELLAAFYFALAEGCAWERWWFEAFDGLRPLASSAALRTSVMNEHAIGIAALARLTETSLSRVLGLLTSTDAARLLAWLGERPAAAATPILVLWKASALLSGARDDHGGMLRALIHAERAAPGAAGGDALRELKAMAALRAASARGELRMGNASDLPADAALRAALAQLSMEAHWLDRLAESDAAQIARELFSNKDSEPSSPEGAAGERLSTQRGGAFVLLKTMDWLGWPALWRRGLARPDVNSDAPDVDLDALVRALAWAVALRALGAHEAARGFGDPALQRVFQVERPLALLRRRRRAVKALLHEASISQTAKALLLGLSSRVPGLAGASPDYLRRNVLTLPATVERHGDGCVVRLGRAPLDILLVLAGAKSGRLALPGGALLELRAEAAP